VTEAVPFGVPAGGVELADPPPQPVTAAAPIKANAEVASADRCQ
jgi:hypothetical protein